MYPIRNARYEDLDAVKRIADANKREIGFVLRPILEASMLAHELLVACKEDGEVVGFLREHRRRDGWNVIYEICVRGDFRGEGIGQLLIGEIQRPIRLKCPEDNEANGFYTHLGFTLAGKEQGKKRRLIVWALR